MKFDPEVEMVLEFARTAREPPSAVRLRNLEAVRSRLGVPGATMAPAADGAGTEKLSAKLRQLLATGVVTGTVGVLIGLGLGRRASDAAPEGQSVQVQSAVAAAVQAAATEARINRETNAAGAAHDDVGSGAIAAVQTETPSVVSELENTPAATEQKAVARAGLARAGLTQQGPPDHARVGQRSAKAFDGRPTKPIDRSFFVALRLLERARHALDVGEPMLARSLLDELDERFPPDLLEEERLATRALGWCALNEHGRAESAARQLLARSPRSIYAERLEQSCVRARATGSK